MIIEAPTLATAPDQVRPRRALLSVFDKRGLVNFASGLHARGIELVSSGGTAAHLRAAGLEVVDVADVTNHPEMLGGRVKTLHPAIHGAILARRGMADDDADLAAHGIAPIDLVVVNLYPFEEAIRQPDITDALAAENVDIGGPALIRAAAKNFAYVGVVTSPQQYDGVLDALDKSSGALSRAARRDWAQEAFALTAAYDRRIAAYLNWDSNPLPQRMAIDCGPRHVLRYGENPHQRAAFYGNPDARYEHLHGKALSYNNLIDLDAALALISEFEQDRPTVAILKHTNPCGVSSAATLEEAWGRAFATDTQSPFGGIVIMNRSCDRAVAEAVDRIFTELIIAPAFDSEAFEWLARKKNRRLIRFNSRSCDDLQLRSAFGGLLVQDPDSPACDDPYTTVTEREPTADEQADLAFAWRIAKHVKSNAIVYAKDGQTLGIGAGQMSRVDASEIAVAKGHKSGLSFEGCVVASDAFFPFADGLIAAADSGARAVVQPGGSIRDPEVIAAANERGLAMVFTGKRHFKH